MQEEKQTRPVNADVYDFKTEYHRHQRHLAILSLRYHDKQLIALGERKNQTLEAASVLKEWKKVLEHIAHGRVQHAARAAREALKMV